MTRSIPDAAGRYWLPILLLTGVTATRPGHSHPMFTGGSVTGGPTLFAVAYLILLALSVAIAGIVAWIAWQRRTQRCAVPLLVLAVLVAILSASSAAEAMATGLAGKEFWVNVQYVGYALLPIAYLSMVVHYIGFQRWLTPVRALLLSAIPIITLALAWTNDYHQLMRRDLFLEPVEGLAFLGKTYGPWHAVATVYSYLVLLASLLLLAWAGKRAAAIHRRQVLTLFVGMVIPAFWSLLYVVRSPLSPRMDLMPPVTAFSMLLIAVAALRFRLLELLPVACHQVVEGMQDGIIVLDGEGRVVGLNPSAGRMLAADRAKAVGRSATELLGRFPEVLEPVLAGAPPAYVTASPAAAGPGVHWEIRVSALLSGRGHPLGRLIVLHDVSERRQAEEELRTMEARMRQAQKLESLGVLAGGVAHDFNNLLQVILSNADLAMMSLAEAHPMRKLLQGIVTSSERAAALANQMLSYSGKGRFFIEVLDLSRLVSEMADLLRSLASRKVPLTFDVPEGLPAIHADAAQIRQLIVYLVSNAVEAIGDREGTIAIRVRRVHATRQFLDQPHQPDELKEGDYLQLEVTDDGCGMDEATQARVFEPFFTTKFTGRGLGMAAALGIVRAHHGVVRIESMPGRGTTVTVLLPSSDVMPPAEEADVPHFGHWQGRGTILVIDDEASIRDAAVASLRTYGYEVLAAGDGVEGLGIFRHCPDQIDAVVLDLAMPRMSGEDALPALREVRSDVPIILTTGYPEEEAVRRFGGKGLSGFLQKPYRPHVLAERLRNLLGQDDRPAAARTDEGERPE